MSGTATQSARLGFRRHLRPDPVDGDAVYLFSERDVTALQGPHIDTLARLLDGSRDLAGLLRDVPGEIPADQATSLVTSLVEADLLRVGPDDLGDGPEPAYWEAAGLDPVRAIAGVQAARVRLIALGGTDASSALAAIGDAGLDVAAGPDDDGADLSIVLCDDYLADGLRAVDAEHRAAGRPWLIAKVDGARMWIGPVFQPGQACWQCLAARLWSNRPAEAYVQSALGRAGHVPRPPTSLPALRAAALHLVALEATKWLAGHRYPGQQEIWTLDSVNLQTAHHTVRIRPQCSECGEPGAARARAWRPVELAPSPAARTPGELLDEYRHLVSPLTGVLKEIRRDRRGPAFLNVFRAGAPQAYGARRVTGLRAAQLMENGGKGTTAQQGEASALCEALERHCGTWRGDEERIRADYRSVADTAIHPDTCQLYHDRQFADRGQWNARNSPFQFVCDPFDETAELDWSPVWSVTEQRHRLLPTGLLYYRAPAAADRTFVRAHSSGNAAGSDLTDAVLRGVLELVERDCVALWWYNRTRHPGLDLAAFGNPWLAELREVYRGLRREVWALDVTSDLGVPTVVALSRRIDKPAEDIMFGFGSHPDPATALISACTEMNQLMPALVDVDADGGYGVTDPDAVRWWTTATVGAQPHLLPDPDRPLRGPGDFGPAATADTLGQLDGIRRGIEGQGMHLLVLDQTRPDIGLPVVKVIVPGLRHMWARYAPGRLYDVPVRQGLLAEPTPYEQLNPIPLFV